MAKRKRRFVATPVKKRPKRQEHPHGAFDEDREYKLRSIIGETATHYHISWEDDEVTGEAYPDTWEPKELVNQFPIDDWELQRAETVPPELRIAASRQHRKPTRSSPPELASPPRTRRDRSRKVIVSSSPPREALANDPRQEATSGAAEEVPEIDESQHSDVSVIATTPDRAHREIDSPLLVAVGSPAASDRPEPPSAVVQNPEPPSSYLAGAYELVSSSHSPASQRKDPPEPSQYVPGDTTTTTEDTTGVTFAHTTPSEPPQSLPVANSQASNGIIPDSQVINSSASYVAHTGTTFSSSVQQPESQTQNVRPNSAQIRGQNDPEADAAAEDPVLPQRQSPTSPELDPQSQQHGGSDPVLVSEADNVVEIPSTAPQPSTYNDQFEITPPSRPVYDNSESTFPRPGLNSSAWLPGHETTRPQSSPLRPELSHISEFSTIPPRALSEQYSTVRSLSFTPHLPLQSIERPSTPDRPIMDPTKSTPSSAESLLAKVDAIRNRGRPSRRRQETPTSTPAISTTGAAQAVSSPLIATQTSAAVPVPAALASPFLSVRDRPRSPSVVPADAPLPVITQKEMNTSGRYETLLPQAHEANSDIQAQNTRGTIPTTTTNTDKSTGVLDPENDTVHAIPIAFSGHQRDQYQSLVWYHRETVSEVLNAQFVDHDLRQKAAHFLQRARHVAMHPDLDNSETLTQFSVDESQQAEWDVKCSAKFRFLKELLDRLVGEPIRVVVVSRPGRIIDMLETFLKGLRLPPTRVDPEGNEMIHQGTHPEVILLSTEDEPHIDHCADLIVSMDAEVKHDMPIVRGFRKNEETNSWCPFIRLVVPHTVEHVSLCLAANLSEKARVRALISGLNQCRMRNNKSEEEHSSVQELATLLSRFIKENSTWNLVELEPLEDFDSQTDSELENPATNGYVEDIHARASAKRSREGEDSSEDDSDAHKKARLASSQRSANPLDVTHISDSVGKSTPVNALGGAANVAPPPSTSIELRLQDLVVDAERRVKDGEKALSNLQFRHEEQRNELVEMTRQRDNAINTAQAAVERLSEQSNLRSKVKDLEQQLKDASDRLLSHDVPEIAEFEALRITTAAAVADKDKLAKRVEQLTNDNTYVRGLYQESSSSAQQLAMQNTELENSLAVAENRATGEQAKLRQMGYDIYTRNLEKDNKKLKSVLQDREAGIKFRDDEIAKLKEASRGRMGTRGTSVPRSPRMGSPRKATSRQSSPLPGELRGKGSLLHPLRNT